MNIKDLPTFIKDSMRYRQVLTYTISNDDTRGSFEELLDEMEFKKMDDQSTWVLPFSSNLTPFDVVDRIKDWNISDDAELDKGDFIQIFSAVAVEKNGKNYPGIDSRLLVYNSKTMRIELAKGL